MDKNSWIGLGLIAAILIGFSWFNRPSKEELARRQHVRDSIALVEQQKMEAAEAQKALEAMQQDAVALDSAQLMEQAAAQYGAFAGAAMAVAEEMPVVENNLLRLTFSPKGGVLHCAELKDYKAYGDSVNLLRLFRGEEYDLGFTLVTANNRVLNTANLYFAAQAVETDEEGNQTLRVRLNAEDGAYLDFVYVVPQNDYMIGFRIECHGMQNVLAQNANSIEMQWHQLVPQQERGRKFEERYAQLQYMFVNRDMEKLSESKADREKESGKIRWIAYKDQFFSTVMIADSAFTSTDVASQPMQKNSGYMKEYNTTTAVQFDPSGKVPTSFRMYLGPNKYHTLKAYDKGKQRYEELRLHNLVPLGWEIVAWIVRILVIPMFDLFSGWGLAIGWVIFLMTLVIKLIILPFTFKSYQSSAKMRVLKPQLDEINAKYPAEKMQERQQATMALYSKAGVSPMSGCLPMLFQMPIVMAMFWFFPTAIELRGQSFLWADDLSAYDAIITWSHDIPLIGNHISLFCILMTVTNIVYTYLNMQSQAGGNDPNMKVMKYMMYGMPVMFFFIFNDYAAGLSYYYFISLLMTIVQTYIFRWTLNDKRVLADMEKAQAKKGKKVQKKSAFMERLEKMQKEQEARMREQVKQQSKQARR
ncbi:MAG: membrane protein insertase YidC [Bacteroidales bacterium]|nr:membrane protein insertase YidC [Candidatus Colicola faecequi]